MDHVCSQELVAKSQMPLASPLLAPSLYARIHGLLKPWVRRNPTAAVKYPGFWKDFILDPHPE